MSESEQVVREIGDEPPASMARALAVQNVTRLAALCKTPDTFSKADAAELRELLQLMREMLLNGETVPKKERKSKGRAINKPERGTIQDALSILGKADRTVRAMAAKGKIPGAAKIEGTWTFNLDLLRNYVSSKEQEAWQRARPQRAVSGGRASSTVGFKPAAKTSNGHYEQTIQKLLQAAGRQSELTQ
jgi:hypothetical protein